jgi:hypothetical protein
MLVKYFGEFVFYRSATGRLLTPFNFLSPLMTARYPAYPHLPDLFIPVVILWSLPFIWVGVGMSIRRAADANISPWSGLLFFVPGLNYILMVVLAVAPSSRVNTWVARAASEENRKVQSPILLSILFALIGTLLAWFNTNILGMYATSLFIGSPLILGLVQGYFLNCKKSIGLTKTVNHVTTTVFAIHLLLLLFALEGLICLAMSLPICAMLGAIGAAFGAALATFGNRGGSAPAMLLLVLPVWPFAESKTNVTHRDMVLSVIDIDAPPAQVWPNVVKFSDLPLSRDWLFELGVAHPLRARIDGQGVGAIRHCEFSTGAFVEPITAWEEPHRLAFDVRYQPQPMKELSFYDHVDAPHLNGYFRSVRGEFRLVPIGNGRTRLEGRTWYKMDMQPGWYWQFYGRWFIHKIHLRVLDHIKHLTEGGA